jgi:hypothetical protein
MNHFDDSLPTKDEERRRSTYKILSSAPKQGDDQASDVKADSIEQRPKLAGSPGELKAIRAIVLPEQAAEERRFSLLGLFALITFASVVLALGRYLPPQIFAGVTGAATLASMIALSLLRGPPLVIQLAWWMLLAIYLGAIAWAVLT